MRRLLSLGMWVVFAGCSGGADDTGLGDTGLDDTGETDDTGPTGTFSGVLSDASGPLADAAVSMCRTVCITVTTDSTGGFAFEPLLVQTYTFHAEPAAGVSGLAEPVFPVTIEETGTELDVFLPALGSPVSLPGTTAELEIASSLFVEAAAGDVTIPLDDDPTELAGVLVSPENYPVLGLNGTPVALWYLDPFDGEADPGLPVRIENDFSLAEGDSYELWMASYDEARWVSMGVFTVQVGGELTDEGVVLPEISTLALLPSQD